MLVFLALMMAAYADPSVKVEAGLDVPLTPPQAQIFETGAIGMIKVEFPLSPSVDVGPVGSVQAFPSEDGSAHGVAWGLGATGRLKVPHEIDTKFSPWIDGDLLFGQTDNLSRPSFALGAGVAVPLDTAKSAWVGPFVRYGHVFQENRDQVNFDNRDARLLSFGVSLEVGKRLVKDPVCQACTTVDIAPIPCPQVTSEQLSAIVYFAYDKTDIQPDFAAKLDTLVAAIGDNADYVVILRGHTDSDGSYAYNQDLSNRRSAAVTQYLVNRGVNSLKIQKDGYSESMPADTNDTLNGRANNRRVEIVVFIQDEVK